MPDNRKLAEEIVTYIKSHFTKHNTLTIKCGVQSILDRHYPETKSETNTTGEDQPVVWIRSQSPVTDVEEIRRQFAQEILNGFINKSIDIHKYSFTVQEITMMVNLKLKGGRDE